MRLGAYTSLALPLHTCLCFGEKWSFALSRNREDWCRAATGAFPSILQLDLVSSLFLEMLYCDLSSPHASGHVKLVSLSQKNY